MTSAGEYFGRSLGTKRAEKLASDVGKGIEVVTEIGLWIEKKEATCISAIELVGTARVELLDTYQEDEDAGLRERLVDCT